MPTDDSTPDESNDPEADLHPGDPSADLRPDDPSERFVSDDPETGLAPEIPTVSSSSPEDVDPELKKQFWTQVVLFNVALFGMSLGLMLVGFEGRWQVGGAMFAVGAVAFVRGWLGYQSVRKD